MATTTWNQSTVQSYIDDEIEESLTLDYKGADSLGKSDGKKKEITKDVSAMANSSGGIIIYGIREYSDPNQRHLPERIDPIDRNAFSKEWLEHIVNNIRPRINGVVIHSVQLDTGSDHVIYVVDVPQSTTAHQATDHRYYKRFNFESISMEDYEIRDVMSRATVADISVDFQYRSTDIESHRHNYVLEIYINNLGINVVNNFKLEFTFPSEISTVRHLIQQKTNMSLSTTEDGDRLVRYYSKEVLFPQERFDVGEDIVWRYQINEATYQNIRQAERSGKQLSIYWTLYADNMPRKQGSKAFKELNRF